MWAEVFHQNIIFYDIVQIGVLSYTNLINYSGKKRKQNDKSSRLKVLYVCIALKCNVYCNLKANSNIEIKFCKFFNLEKISSMLKVYRSYRVIWYIIQSLSIRHWIKQSNCHFLSFYNNFCVCTWNWQYLKLSVLYHAYGFINNFSGKMGFIQSSSSGYVWRGI